MIRTCKGVVLDGATPIRYEETLLQPLNAVRAVDVIVRCTVVGQDGEALALAGCAGVLTIKAKFVDTAPVFATAGVLSGTATFDFVIPAAALDTSTISHFYDIVLVDTDGLRHQVVRMSPFKIEPSLGIPGTPLTAPAASYGLGLIRQLDYTMVAATDTFVVPLDPVEADINFRAFGFIQSGDVTIAVSCPDDPGDKAVNGFRVVLSDALAIGDRLHFYVTR